MGSVSACPLICHWPLTGVKWEEKGFPRSHVLGLCSGLSDYCGMHMVA